MGEIFFLIGAWLMVSGIKDIRTASALEVIDEIDETDSTLSSETEKSAARNAVA